VPEKPDSESSVDIYQLLLEASKRRRREERAQLLRSVGVKEYFQEGSIRIDMRTCRGTECEICIKVCPTNALYWRSGEIGVVEDLCVFCGACVLNCIVDNCIQVTRRRPNGEVERFSTPEDVLTLLYSVNSRKRRKMVRSRFPDDEAYLKRYWVY
jgi:ferredoxin